ncbi:MAG TPA: NAD-dependent epimerase/dehydratase family protein [Longimicrobiales bacterium]
MRVFLTGGTGLVGSHVARRLRERGHDVVALVRPGREAPELGRLGVVRVEGDVCDAVERLSPLMAGCDAVVHAAAELFARDAGRFGRVNVEGTERVLRAAGAAGVRRVLHVSSIAVYGQQEGRVPLGEEAWREGRISRGAHYARSKRAAEEAAWRLHDAGLVRLTVVRPGVVYGEGDRWFMPRLAAVLRLPVVPLPDGGRRRLPLVYAGNLADGIVSAVERDEAAGRAYNLSADHPVRARELVELFGRALGRSPRCVSIPPSFLRLAAVAGDAAARLLPGRVGPGLRRAVGRLLTDDPYDTTRARRELGWHGRVGLEEAVARTAGWYRSRHG